MDPITLEVITSSLTAFADEMTNSFWKSSYSYFNYEIRDFAVGYIDAEGRIITQSRYTHPAFTGDLGFVVKGAADRIGLDAIAEGDVIATNDPIIQGQHLNNVVVFTPVFWDGRLFGYSCVRAHLHDIGGAAIGSGSPSTREIFQEGLQIPAAHIYRKGQPNNDVLGMIEANSRFPEIVMGDLNAQMAASRLGHRRFCELLARFGPDLVAEAIEKNWDMTESAARASLAKTTPGTYSAESFLDNDGVSNNPVHIGVRVVVTPEHMTIDFSDVANQVAGSLNSGYYGGATNVGRIAFKCLTTPQLPSNEGCFRPLTIICPEGKILNARRPAALYEWSVIFPTVIDTVLKAISGAAPGRVPAATRGDARGAGISGFDVARRKYFSVHMPHPGGHGGRPDRDGPAPKCAIQQGNEYGMPVEISEAKYHVVYDRYALRNDSGGPGRFRGGFGVEVIAHMEMDSTVRNNMIRSDCLPWGLDGGRSGAGNQAFLLTGGEEAAMSRRVEYDLPAGHKVRVLTGGGGGYGDPFERDVERVADDVVDEYVSVEAAARDYGVAVTSDGIVDEQRTKQLRANGRAGA
jgi:N-methylhydantoinase B